MPSKIIFFILLIILYTCSAMSAQDTNAPDSILNEANLQNCIQYALKHQPTIQQSIINEHIARQQIKSKLVLLPEEIQ